MKNKSFYLFLLVVFTSLFSQNHDPYRLTRVVEPEYQFLHFDLDPNKKEYSANTTIHLNVSEEISEFRLHGTDFEINKIDLLSGDESTKVGYEFLEHGFLKILFPSVLAPGKYKLKFRFQGEISEKGEGIINFEKDSLSYIYTQMETRYARQFFPSFDEPGFKFPYQIEITSPGDLLVVSNTSIEKESRVGKNKTVLFKATKPMPSYLLAFAVGPYDSTTIPGLSIPGRLILPKGYLKQSHYIKDNTAAILKALEQYLGYPYPYDKMDFIGVSNSNFPAMENPGLIAFENNYLIDQKDLSRDEKLFRASLTAHELAHMWFGNLVTLHWWEDTWLNEGFATWLENEVVMQEFQDLLPKEKFSNDFESALGIDTGPTPEPIHQDISGFDNPWDSFDRLTYEKSGMLIRLIENWIGKPQFQQAMQKYFSEFQWKNVNAQDMVKILQNISDKDVETVLNDFVYQVGIPVVSVTIENENSVHLEQQRYKTILDETNYDTMWHMPISCKIFDGQKVHERFLYMNQQTQSFHFPELDKIKWIHLRNNLLGYLIQVNPPDMLTQIIQTDMLDTYEKQDVLNGLKYEFLAGNYNPRYILDLGYQMRYTQDEAVMNALVGRIDNIQGTYFADNTNDDFLFYCSRTLRPMLDKVGYGTVEDELGITRESRMLLLWLLKHDPQIREQLTSLGEKYLYGDKNLTMDSIYYIVLLIYFEGNASMYDHVMNRFRDTKNPIEREIMLYSLGFFQDSSLVNKNKLFILNGDMAPNDRIALAEVIQGMYYGLERKGNNILPWIAEHFEFFEQTVSSDVLDRVLPNFIYDMNDVELFFKHFPEEKISKTLSQNVTNRIEGFKQTDKFRKLYSTDLEEYLKEFRNRIEQ